ncbi:MAG: ABC transporter ATP-binding protein [Patescibacteria group bacterium]|nr:ABC transporter ATP-binding protein [Patescibacteria group bacterium]
MNHVVTLDNISKKYPGTPDKWVVQNVNLKVSQGEFFCLIGPSGCGKSTLLKMIAGIETPTSGNITKPSNISMVFQSGALLPWLTVKENVTFGLKMANTPKHLIESQVAEYLRMVNLVGFNYKYPRQLSGGQRQRVGIARALAVKPEVLLLDEPFSALDPLTTEELHQDLLKIWQDTKITIIMVSHLLEEAILLADRIGIMKDGNLKEVTEVNLQRPRNRRSEQFFELGDKLYKLIQD